MSRKRRLAMAEARRKRSHEMAIEGRKLEDRIELILEGLVNEGEIDSYTRHRRMGYADRHGRDFTVRKVVAGPSGQLFMTERSFDPTVSWRSLMRANTNHPQSPSRKIWFTVGTSADVIRKRILELFDRNRG